MGMRVKNKLSTFWITNGQSFPISNPQTMRVPKLVSIKNDIGKMEWKLWSMMRNLTVILVKQQKTDGRPYPTFETKTGYRSEKRFTSVKTALVVPIKKDCIKGNTGKHLWKK